MRKKVYLAIFFVLAATFICSTAMVGVMLYRYRQADREYGALQEQYVSASGQTEQTPGETAPISVDLDALRQENGDITGWLYCEGTPINYPVVQGGDNEQYLHRDLHGKYLYSGTLFVDCRCQVLGTEQNHIIYGHNMKNGAMFGTLVRYKEQSYYDEHPVLYYLTPDCDYKIELFAGFVTKSDSEVYRPRLGDTGDSEAFLQSVKAKSTFASDVAVTGEDLIVTLSTCSYEFNDARYVVFGKLTALSTRGGQAEE